MDFWQEVKARLMVTQLSRNLPVRCVAKAFWLPASPKSNHLVSPKRVSWRNEKLRAKSWKLEPNPTVIRKGLPGVRPLRVIRDQYLSTRAIFDTDILHTRWTLLEMRKDALYNLVTFPSSFVARALPTHQNC